MRRKLARLLLLALMALSGAGLAVSLATLARDPTISALREATGAEITAALDRALLAEATPEKLAKRLGALIAEDPRDWVVIDALADLADERQIPLPTDLSRQIAEARATDEAILAQAESCAACAYDAALCTLSQVAVCHLPVALTPLGDVAGVVRAGAAYAAGEAVDEVDLSLSLVGLAATGAVLVTAGGSETVKIGASLAKTAARMGRLSPALVRLARDTLARAARDVDFLRWDVARTADDLALSLRPLTEVTAELHRLSASTNLTTVLHLLPMVDGPAEARALSRLGEAVGPRLIGRAEVLGKARLVRAATRVTGTAWSLMSGFAGLALALAGLVGQGAQSLALRSLKRHLTAR